MSISDLLLPEWDQETKVTRAVLERVPDDHAEWKPHPKSFPMAHLAQLVARLPGWVNLVMERTEIDIAKGEFPGYSIEKTAALLAEFDKNVANGRDAIARAKDADFDVPWSFKAPGKPALTMPRYMMLRTMTINHLVHHRAQLGLYLRMVDERVPPMYGPTADDH